MMVWIKPVFCEAWLLGQPSGGAEASSHQLAAPPVATA
jgi:hypothetical protein